MTSTITPLMTGPDFRPEAGESFQWHFTHALHAHVPPCCAVEFALMASRVPPAEWHHYFRRWWARVGGEAAGRALGLEYFPCARCAGEIRAGRQQPARFHRCDPRGGNLVCLEVLQARRERAMARHRRNSPYKEP
jgi:hypothetical protein